jgi:hypothetical protein
MIMTTTHLMPGTPGRITIFAENGIWSVLTWTEIEGRQVGKRNIGPFNSREEAEAAYQKERNDNPGKFIPV